MRAIVYRNGVHHCTYDLKASDALRAAIWSIASIDGNTVIIEEDD